VNESAVAADLLCLLFTTGVNFSLYDSEKLERMKKVCVLNVNADEMMKSEHVRGT